MGIRNWRNLFHPRETRAETVSSDSPEFYEFMRAHGAPAPDAVLSNLAVAARCVGLLSESLAGIPLHVFRRTADGGRERADDHPLYAVLHDSPNPNQTAFEAREFLIRDLLLFGNAFARLDFNARGQVVALWPVPWRTVGVDRLPGGRLRYRVTDADGRGAVLLQEEALHIRYASRDGAIGLSPIAIGRGALGLALEQANTAESLMRNAMRPSGILSFAEKMSPEAMERVRTRLEERFTGTANAGRVVLMDGGAKYDKLTWSPEDAQFLESRKLANEDVARIFGIPPTCVGITDRATYSNTEQEATALVRNALAPLAARVEQAIARACLTPAARRALYVEHDLSALLRGDVKSRFEAYRIGREIGALSADDVRRRENEPPIPGGNIYHQPANWVPLGTAPAGTTEV